MKFNCKLCKDEVHILSYCHEQCQVNLMYKNIVLVNLFKYLFVLLDFLPNDHVSRHCSAENVR